MKPLVCKVISSEDTVTRSWKYLEHMRFEPQVAAPMSLASGSLEFREPGYRSRPRSGRTSIVRRAFEQAPYPTPSTLLLRIKLAKTFFHRYVLSPALSTSNTSHFRALRRTVVCHIAERCRENGPTPSHQQACPISVSTRS